MQNIKNRYTTVRTIKCDINLLTPNGLGGLELETFDLEKCHSIDWPSPREHVRGKCSCDPTGHDPIAK